MFPSINWWGFPSGPTCALPSHGLHRLLSHSICAAVERKLHQRTGFQVSEGPNEIWDANHCCVYQDLNVSAKFWSKMLAELWKCASMVFRFRDWTSQWGIFFLGLEIHNGVARIDTCIVRQRVYLQILSQVCNLAMSETLVCWFFFQVIITILKRARHIIGDLKLVLTMTDYKAWRWNEISCNSCLIPLCPGLCVDSPLQVFVGLHLRPAIWAHGPKTGLQPRPNFSKWRCKGQHQYSLRSLLVWISI